MEAESELRGTLAKDKHELLFSRFNLNYNDVRAMFKKGSIILRSFSSSLTTTGKTTAKQDKKKQNVRTTLQTLHEDLIKESFWENHNIFES